MNFGIFHLMPRRRAEKTVREIYADSVEQTRVAEELGFDIAWFAEHHFSNYCMCPSPLVMAAYFASQTESIRLGTACLVTPLYHPARMLEEIGMVDNLASGRLVVGLGSGYQNYEFERFDVKLEKAKDMFRESLDIYEMAFSTNEYEYEGEFYQIPKAPLSISPVQTEIPETWITGLSDSPELMRRVAQKGYTPFATAGPRSASSLTSVKERWKEKYNEVGRDPDKMPFAIQRNLFISDNPGEVRQAADSIRYTARVATSMRNRTQRLNGNMLEEFPADGELSLEEIETNALIGDVQKCTDQLISEIEEIRPTHISLFVQFGDIPQSQVMHSLDKFGETVLPQVQQQFPN